MIIAPRVGNSYPKTGPQGSARRPAQGRPGASPNRGCVPGVRVPRQIHLDRALKAADVAVYTALLAMRPDGSRTVTATQEEIAAATGREGRAVGAALHRLMTAGFMKRGRRWPSSPYTYTLAVLPTRGDFDVITHSLMRAMARGEISDGALRSWLVIDQALGNHGRTSDTAGELARRRAIAPSTLRAHVDELVALDALEVGMRASRRGWSLADPAVDFTGAETPREMDAPEALEVCPEDAERSPDFRQSGVQIFDGPYLSTPEPSTPASSELCSDRPVGNNAPRDDDNGRKRPKKGGWSWPTGRAYSRPGVLDALKVLDHLAPHWTRSESRRRPSRWLNGIASSIATNVAPEDGAQARLSPPAAVTAIVELADGLLEDHGGRHILAIRAALDVRAREIRQGLACGSCGLPYGPDVRECPWCVSGMLPGPLRAVLEGAGLVAPVWAPEEVPDGALPPLEERLAAYRHLGVPPDEIREGDPEAAAILDAEQAPPSRRRCGHRTALGLDRPLRLRQLGGAAPARSLVQLARPGPSVPQSRRAGSACCSGLRRHCGHRVPRELRARPPPRRRE